MFKSTGLNTRARKTLKKINKKSSKAAAHSLISPSGFISTLMCRIDVASNLPGQSEDDECNIQNVQTFFVCMVINSSAHLSNFTGEGCRLSSFHF